MVYILVKKVNMSTGKYITRLSKNRLQSFLTPTISEQSEDDIEDADSIISVADDNDIVIQSDFVTASSK